VPEAGNARVLPSVVQITTGQGSGSGVVYDTRGDIVTNAHVVGTATTLLVGLPSGGTPLTATVARVFAPDDLAVIRVQAGAGSLHPASFGRSASVRVGEIVLAMGNPLGLTGTVTDGIVSATGRTVSEGRGSSAVLISAVQTSVAINPGNSGGALADLSSQVIGIATLAAADPQLGGAAAGIGFAIPSDTVTSIAAQLIATGKVSDSGRASLSITAQTIADASGQPAGVGAISVTPGGATAKGRHPARRQHHRPGRPAQRCRRQGTVPARSPLAAQAVFGARRDTLLLPEVSACLAVAITHRPPIDAASVASMAVLPVTMAMTPATSASAPMAEAGTT
jgi:S1-C subfamily serine protease